jgi:hypothetical protein
MTATFFCREGAKAKSFLIPQLTGKTRQMDLDRHQNIKCWIFFASLRLCGSNFSLWVPDTNGPWN